MYPFFACIHCRDFAILGGMKTIPFDTRTRIIKRYDTGKFTRMEIAEQFDVSVDFIKKLLKQRNKFGHVKPLHDRVGRKPKMTRQHIDSLRAALQKKPDLTLAQMRGLLGGMCSVVCVHLALKKEKITYKKNAAGVRAGSRRHPRKA